ncbi:MAG TPA: DUF4340 domain-containing protein [Phycisphaerales bacterium]|nr:DUF4340 domain-containing protein [Phycisphaerales bacterium]
MSNKALFAIILIAVGLLGLTLLLNKKNRPTSGTPDGAPSTASTVLHFDPAQVTSICVGRENGRMETVTRAASGRWSCTILPAHPFGDTVILGNPWPASIPGEVTSALSLLADLKAVPAQSAKIPVGSPTIQIGTGASTYLITVSRDTLGGRTLIRVGDQPPVLVDTALVEPFLDPGPASWRLTSAIPGARDASRVSITTPSDNIALARAEGRWSLQRPVAARAAESVVARLLGDIADRTIVRFVDDAKPDPSALGLDKPRLVIRTESDVRATSANPSDGGTPADASRAAELYVGAPADPIGTLLYASPNQQGSIVFVVNAADLSAISTTPRQYISPTATSVAPPSISTILIRHTDPQPFDRGFRRQLNQWLPLTGGGAAIGAQRLPIDADKMTELLDFLCTRQGEPEPIINRTAGAPESSPGAATEPMRALARIELSNSDGDPLDIIHIGYSFDGTLAVRSEGVLILYPKAAPPALLELPDFGSLPPAPNLPTPHSTAGPAPVK